MMPDAVKEAETLNGEIYKVEEFHLQRHGVIEKAIRSIQTRTLREAADEIYRSGGYIVDVERVKRLADQIEEQSMSAAEQYAADMDFRNWFEKREGIPFEDFGTFHHDQLGKWIGEYIAALRAENQRLQQEASEHPYHEACDKCLATREHLRRRAEKAESKLEKLQQERDEARKQFSTLETAIRSAESSDKGLTVGDAEYLEMLGSYGTRIMNGAWFCGLAKRIRGTVSRATSAEARVGELREALTGDPTDESLESAHREVAYKYFGDYEMSDGQRDAVYNLQSAARKLQAARALLAEKGER